MIGKFCQLCGCLCSKKAIKQHAKREHGLIIEDPKIMDLYFKRFHPDSYIKQK